MLTPRHSFVAGVVNGKIYVVGGASERDRRGQLITVSLKTVEVFDPVTNAWQKHADVDAKFARNSNGGAVLNGKLYVMGGAQGIGGGEIKLTTIYDPAANAWADGPLLNEGRGPVPTANVLNGKIYLIGGWSKEPVQAGGNDIAMKNVEEFDPVANAWMKKADMPTGRYLLPPTSPVVGGKIYVIGGFDGRQGRALADVEAYDPATDTWKEQRKMPTARYHFATAVVRGKIYTFGGIDKAGEPLDPIATVEEYTADGWPFAVSPQGKLATAWGRIKAAD